MATRNQALSPWILAIGLAIVVGSPAFGAGSYSIEKVALDGETAPDSGGETFAPIDTFTVDMNASGQVSFGATLSGGFAWGIFAYSDGAVGARALSGDTALEPPIGTYLAFGYPYIDNAGDVSFGAMIRTSPTTSVDAVILAGASSDSLLVSETDDAPGSGGKLDVNVGDLAFHARGPAGAPIFRSTVTGGSNPSGIFVGTGTAVALAGAPSPAGGSYDSFHYPGGNASGTVAFPAFLSGASAASGLFVDSGSGPVPIVLEGDVDPNGETIASMLLPQVNTAGDVMFAAEWEPVVDEEGAIYIHGAGGLRTVLRTAEPVPGTGGGTIVSLDGLPHFSDGGRVTFSASLTGGDFDAGVFVIETNGTVRLVAKSGEPVPGVPGATFASFGHAAGNDAGQVAFAGITDGAANGVFLATAPPAAVPALPPVLLGALAGLMLLVGGGLARRASS